MRIKSAVLTWFRGAADAVALEPNCKSMAVYGCNGSGKSSFVDAVEFVLQNGRVDHLAHEYSGRKYERSIPNTHRSGKTSSLTFTFTDDSTHSVQIARDGSASSSASTTAGMQNWEYRRTVLRQHEVSAFIQATKGEKYSALLPLLGLHPLELAAENLRQLSRTIEAEANLPKHRLTLEQVAATRRQLFGTDTDEAIFAKIEQLHKKYCPTRAATTDPLERCRELKEALEARILASSAELQRYLVLKSVAELDLKGQIAGVRAANSKLADAVEPLIVEKLEVLERTIVYVGKVGAIEEVKCPACGRAIALIDFKSHLEEEKERLRAITTDFNARKSAISTLCASIRSLQATLRKPEIKSWRENIAKHHLAQFEYLDSLDVETLRSSCGEDELQKLERNIQPIIDAAIAATKIAPPDAKELSDAQKTVEAAIAVFEGTAFAVKVKRAETLEKFISSLEQGVRDEIREQAETVIDDISSDVQDMWSILHPGEPIENVRLYLPDGSDKAIEIGLKFHGIDQDSPRLTLSEGHRNSLGLCIFLGMAKREAAADRPVFLDDVVVSFDREHRGMIAELLAKHFDDRQVIIFTHDRDWFTDLKYQLDGAKWNFKTLLSYDTPLIGIRWSHETTTFDDARALLKDRPDSAGNDARKIMDVELGVIAERIQIKLPFRRGDKNDKRMAHEYLQEIVSSGKKALQKKAAADYEMHTTGLDALEEARKLLDSWGNRASHTHDVVRPEATKLINTCESALDVFKCSGCGKYVWHADATNPEYVQCHCGEIRWRYNKS